MANSTPPNTPSKEKEIETIRTVVFKDLNAKREIEVFPFSIYGSLDAPWFLVNQLCSFLDLLPSTASANSIEKSHTKKVQMAQKNTPNTLTDVVGFQFLVAKSSKSNALIFRDWMFEEVLPTLKKTGNYRSPPGPTRYSAPWNPPSLPSQPESTIVHIPQLLLPSPSSVSSVMDTLIPTINPPQIIDADIVETREVSLKRKTPEINLRDLELVEKRSENENVEQKVRKISSLAVSLTEPLKRLSDIAAALGIQVQTTDEKKELLRMVEKHICNELKNVLNSLEK